jgi:hypothetical protein
MPEPAADIEIETDERVFLAGKTDSGKTYIAQRLLRGIERLVVLDPKGTLQSWRLAPWDRESQRLLRNGDPVRTRVKLPAADTLESFWDDILFDCWNAGNVLVYVDEVYLLKPEGGAYPRYLSRLYTTGRERGIGAWASAQRPAWVPLVLMSESEHVFAFRMNLEDDRITLAKNTHPDLEQEIPRTDPHGFRYYNIHADAPEYFPQYSEGGPGKGLGDLGDLVGEESELEEIDER